MSSLTDRLREFRRDALNLAEKKEPASIGPVGWRMLADALGEAIEILERETTPPAA